jgi:hypothetical protein
VIRVRGSGSSIRNASFDSQAAFIRFDDSIVGGLLKPVSSSAIRNGI